jgi:hypothetical protein
MISISKSADTSVSVATSGGPGGGQFRPFRRPAGLGEEPLAVSG